MADAVDSKSTGGNTMGVRPSPRAPGTAFTILLGQARRKTAGRYDGVGLSHFKIPNRIGGLGGFIPLDSHAGLSYSAANFRLTADVRGSDGAHAPLDSKPYTYCREVGHMRRVFTTGLFIFSIMMAGGVMAQERQVLQEGYSGIGTGKIGSGPGGGLDNVWMRNLLAKPETVYGRVWGVDIPGKKVYIETGGGGQSSTSSGNTSTAIVTVELTDKTNVESFKQIKTGDDVEIQAYRTTRTMGSGAFASEVPEGNPKALDISVLRSSVSPSNLLPQAGFNPDTDRAIDAKNASVMGGIGGQCFQCYEGGPIDYKIETSAPVSKEAAPAPKEAAPAPKEGGAPAPAPAAPPAKP
jgi:hypothetical protein